MDEGHPAKTRPVRTRQSARAGPFVGREALVVGLTGGAGTGKSTVAGMLAELGAKVLSADEVVHRMLADDEDIRLRIVKEFGCGILNERGNIDRRKLGDVVFRDAEKRRRLEQILHPPVLNFIESEIEKFRRFGQGVLVVEIPLLVETSSVSMVDKVLLVTAEQETQLHRLEKRYGVSRTEAMLRMRSQLPLDEKRKYADWVIDNEGTMQATREQVQEVWEAIQKQLAQRK